MMTLLTPHETSLNVNSDTAPPAACERHYTVREVAQLLHLSEDAVRRLFEREPGVFILGETGRRGHRRYRTLRIPQSVLDRVYRRHLSVGESSSC